MPHQCVRCSAMYDDGAQEILAGCACGARLFFFVRKEQLKKAEVVTQNLTPADKVQIEKDVKEIIGIEEDSPVILDIESVRISRPGSFELDLVHLFNKKEPLIYKVEEGKYIIDLAETFRRRGGT
ncbi:MAG TPA: Zn-ribbon containing protein [Candidatus Nanoarchaeia archaeon]|nr:Zn-ribbon containing protein [Candidatus Nanoarchaeia archaeon]